MNLADILSEALLGQRRSAQDDHERAVEEFLKLITDEMIDPTKRPIQKIDDDMFIIGDAIFGTEDKDKKDPHRTIILRHPEKKTRWRLYNFCPRAHQAVSYRLKADDEASAIRLANVALDITTGVISEELMDKMIAAVRRRKNDEDDD